MNIENLLLYKVQNREDIGTYFYYLDPSCLCVGELLS